MNQYKFEVKVWSSDKKATEGVNEFIQKCNDEGIKIQETTSHTSLSKSGLMLYVFIFKVDADHRKADTSEAAETAPVEGVK